MTTDLVPFSDLLDAVIDNRGKTCPTSQSGIPLIATNCIQNNLLYPNYEKVRYVSQETFDSWFRAHPKPGDLILVTKGTPGRVCLVPDPVDFCIAQDMVAIRPDPKKIYPKYLFALLRSESVQMQIENMHVGTLIPHFKKGDFDKLLLSVPDRHTQKFIGDLYFETSYKIDVNRRISKTLEDIARATFESWFVNFDPVRFKDDHPHPGLPKSVSDLFPDVFEPSELGLIPRGWRILSIADIADTNTRTLGRTDSLEVIDYVEISAVTSGEIDNIVRYKRGQEPSRARRRLSHGDTVISTVRPERGSHFLSLNPPNTLIASTGFAVLSSKTDNWAFLYAALTRPVVGEELARLAEGGAYPAIRPEALGGVRLSMPGSSEILEQYERFARPFFEHSAQKRLESKTLTGIRDALLPQLISGELRPPGYRAT